MSQTSRAVGLAAVALFTVTALAPAREPGAPPELKKVSVGGGVELHYVERGEGVPVVFVHGTLADYSVWDGYLGRFAKGYRALAYSRRYNYPNTNRQRPGHSAAVDAEDLAGLIQKLAPGKVHVVGHSYGAYTALFLAVKHPELVRSLTLAEPPAVFRGDALDEIRTRVVNGARAAFAKGDKVGGVRAFFPPGAFDGFPAFVRERVLRNAPELEACVTAGELYAGLDREAVRKIDAPVLLLSGENSWPFLKKTEEELERLLPGKGRRHVVIRGADHIMLAQKPEECARAILDFLGAN